MLGSRVVIARAPLSCDRLWDAKGVPDVRTHQSAIIVAIVSPFLQEELEGNEPYVFIRAQETFA